MVKIFKDPEAVVKALADFIVVTAEESISRNGRFTIALSGGSSPKALYRVLASQGYQKKIEWEHVYFFFGDERYVPAESSESNFRMARESLFEPLNIADDHIFAVRTTLSPADAARSYEQEMVKYFRGYQCSFDLILLGLGDNSHTASLFPHTSILKEKNALVKEIFVKEVNMYRITFTAPLINQAQRVAFLVYGASKAEAVRHILDDPLDAEEYPAQLVSPVEGEVYWFMDEPASKMVSGKQ